MKLLAIFLLCLSAAFAREEGLMEHIINTNMRSRQAPANLVEGDMLIPDNALRGGIKNEWYRWPKTNGLVEIPYVVDNSLGYYQYQAFLEAIKDYNSYTCIRWIPRSSESNYVRLINGGGCWSYIGRLGWGRQDLSLGSGCEYKSTAIHEMMHAAGFYHTQSRTDRDYYVTTYMENCMSDQTHNFDKQSTDQIILYGEYDIYSVMHYDCYSFSYNGRPTITKKGDPSCTVSLGQPYVGGGFRTSDIYKLNTMYEC